MFCIITGLQSNLNSELYICHTDRCTPKKMIWLYFAIAMPKPLNEIIMHDETKKASQCEAFQYFKS
jgi:hypothetical protein